MKTKNETQTLDEMIFDLERKRAIQLDLMKEQFQATYQSFKLSNILKNTFHELTSSPEVKNNLVSNAIGIGTGILSKKLLVGGSRNPIKKLFGTLVQLVVSNVVARNTDGIKSKGGNLLQRLLRNRNEDKTELQEVEND